MRARYLGVLAGLIAVIIGGVIGYLHNSGDQSRGAGAISARAVSNSSPSAGGAIPSTNAADWRAKLDQIAPSGAIRAGNTKQVADLLFSVPPNARADATREVIKLAPDKDSKALVPLLRNRDLPKEVNQILFADLMGRTESVKLPALAEIADTPGDPHHDEAVAALENALGNDSGQSGMDWESAVQRYFQQKEVKAREDALKLNLMKAQQQN